MEVFNNKVAVEVVNYDPFVYILDNQAEWRWHLDLLASNIIQACLVRNEEMSE